MSKYLRVRRVVGQSSGLGRASAILWASLTSLALACGSSEDGGPGSEGGGNSGTGAMTASGSATSETGGSSTGSQSGSGASGSGSSGSGASGSGASSSGGADPGMPPTNTLVGACRTYVMAQCWRGAECNGSQSQAYRDNCERTAINACPDAVFSDGSAHTIDTVLACAEVWKSYECQNLYDLELPDCVLEAGTRSDGESCIYTSQCENECATVSGESCGRCAPVTTDGTCSLDLSCRGVARCDDGQCVAAITPPESDSNPPIPPPEQDPVPPVGPALGEACTDSCADESVCTLVDQDDDDSGLTCQPPRNLGDDCLRYYDQGFVQMRCGNELICAPDNTCQENGKDGQPCFLDIHNTFNCEYGTYCTSANQCEKPKGAGQPCVYSMDYAAYMCLEGQTCVDDVCFVILPWGQSGCSENGHKCEHGTQCENDTCMVDDESHLFGEACGG